MYEGYMESYCGKLKILIISGNDDFPKFGHIYHSIALWNKIQLSTYTKRSPCYLNALNITYQNFMLKDSRLKVNLHTLKSCCFYECMPHHRRCLTHFIFTVLQFNLVILTALTYRPEPIMLLKSPIMLLDNAPKISLLCFNYAQRCPIMP